MSVACQPIELRDESVSFDRMACLKLQSVRTRPPMKLRFRAGIFSRRLLITRRESSFLPAAMGFPSLIGNWRPYVCDDFAVKSHTAM